EQLTQRGLLLHKVLDGDICLASLAAIAAPFLYGAMPVGRQRLQLSRFAYLHRHGDEAVLESPRSHACLWLHDPRAVALLGFLAAPFPEPGATEGRGSRSIEAVAKLVSLGLRAALLVEPGDEERDLDLKTWEFHDLLFHAHSRRARLDAGYGGTYRFANK